MAIPDPIFRLTNGTTIIDLLDYNSGWHLADPNWNPQIAQLKGGGSTVNSSMADGQFLVFKKYNNVVETIPLSVSGKDQAITIATIRGMLKSIRQAEDYWTEIYEDSDWRIEFRPPCKDCFIGYSRIHKARIEQLTNPLGQPFFSNLNSRAVMEDLVLVVEREPFWRAVPPGSIIGPLYNLIKNSDFEFWTDGNEDEEPDNWSNIETTHITGTNNREQSSINAGQNALRIEVRGSTLTGAAKGVSQVAEDTVNGETYTFVGWVRSNGVSNGVGRILITYSSQLEVYRDTAKHGWKLVTGVITLGADDVVAITAEILTTAANTDGTVYFDSFMLLQGNWQQEARDGVLPYISSSHVVNHWDTDGVIEEGDINFVDVWNVPGDVDSLVRVEVQNNTTPADTSAIVEKYRRVRIGQRRTRDVFNFENIHLIDGVADTDVAGGVRTSSPLLTPGFQNVTQKIISGSDMRGNLGRFRLLARVKDTRPAGAPNLEVRASFFIGSSEFGRKDLQWVPALVRGEWTMLDLTPNQTMNMDLKFSPTPPTQLGYYVQMKRDVGDEVGRFNFSIAMPTDGGYMNAILNPPITKGGAFVVDNTGSGIVGAVTKGNQSGYQTVFTPSEVPLWLTIFNGDLYIACENGKLFRITENETGAEVADYGANDLATMEKFDGELYIAHGLEVFKTRGDTFSDVPIFTVPIGTSISDMEPFKGKLYVTVNGASGPVYSWDGSTLTQVLVTGLTNTSAIEHEHNRLYVGTSGGTARILRSRNGTDWATDETALAGATGVTHLFRHRDNIFAATGASGRLFRRKGKNNWDEIEQFTDFTNFRLAREPHETLFAAGITGTGPIFSSTDTNNETWAKILDTTDKTVNFIKWWNGKLMLATTGSDIDTVMPTSEGQDVEYKTAEYRGTLFASPPEKRHRYFFSYDREENINVVDDKALIGLGFVPLYLSLRGRG